MKWMLLFLLLFITGCQPPTNEEGINLEIEAQYTSGTLYITPVVVHDGLDNVTVELYDSEVRVIEVIREGETVYQRSLQSASEEPVLLNQGDSYEAALVRFTANPGEYEVHAIAELTLDDGDLEEELSLEREVILQVE